MTCFDGSLDIQHRVIIMQIVVVVLALTSISNPEQVKNNPTGSAGHQDIKPIDRT